MKRERDGVSRRSTAWRRAVREAAEARRQAEKADAVTQLLDDMFAAASPDAAKRNRERDALEFRRDDPAEQGRCDSVSIQFAEDHPSGTGLQHTGDGNVDQ